MIIRPGTLLDGKYLLHEQLGDGRSGLVYRATHVALQTLVAVKVLRPSVALAAGEFARFRTEAETLARLAHPHIVRVLDFGVAGDAGGTPYLVLELVTGETLEARCHRLGPLPAPLAAAWLAQVAGALDHAHRHGIIHGDLSARNILIDGDGAAATLSVIDFGGSVHLDEPRREPTSGPVIGTPEYWAPEIVDGGAPSVRSDIYAAGVLAYRMIAGRAPFIGRREDIAVQHLGAPPPSLGLESSGAAAALDRAVRSALAKTPSDRPATAGALAAAVTGAARRLARSQWRRRERAPRLALAGILAVASGAISLPMAHVPAIARIEAISQNMRVRMVAPRAPAPVVLLVSLDEPAVSADARPLSLRGDEIGHVLSEALALGASAVALDLLLPETWARADPFRQLLLTHPDRVVLAAAATTDAPVGPESVDPLVVAALGPARAGALFGFANHGHGPDGIVRRVQTITGPGPGHATFAGRTAALGRSAGTPLKANAAPRLIDYRVASTAFARVGWTTFADGVGRRNRLDGRLVVVGAEFVGSGDRHRVPAPRGQPGEVSGLTLQALAIDTLLPERPPLDEVAAPLSWGLLSILILLPAAGIALLSAGVVPGLVSAGALAAVWATAAVVAFAGGWVLPVVAPVMALAVLMSALLVARGHLSSAPE